MSKQSFLITGLVLALLAAAGWYLSGGKTESQLTNLTTAVKRGPFEIYAVATGELKAKNSVKISGPQKMSLRHLRTRIGHHQKTLSHRKNRNHSAQLGYPRTK